MNAFIENETKITETEMKNIEEMKILKNNDIVLKTRYCSCPKDAPIDMQRDLAHDVVPHGHILVSFRKLSILFEHRPSLHTLRVYYTENNNK